jgi:hypothetical protein
MQNKFTSIRIKPARKFKGHLIFVVALGIASVLFINACNNATPIVNSRLTTATSTANQQSSEKLAGTQPIDEKNLASTASKSVLFLSTPTTSPDCTYTLYYWKNNPDRWLAENIIIGRTTYSKKEALQVLSSETPDTTTNALQQFFAVALNILKGSNPGAIEKEINAASLWLNSHPIGYELTEDERQQGQAFVQALHAYNAGEVGPGPCADEPSTATPVPTATSTATSTTTVTPTTNPKTPTEAGPKRRTIESPASTAVPTSSAPSLEPTTQPTSTSKLPETSPPPARPTATDRPTPTSAPPETPVPPQPPTEPPPTEQPPTPAEPPPPPTSGIPLLTGNT